MKKVYYIFLVLVALLASCKGQKKATALETYQPDWHRGVVYEMNVRQYTPEGTFDAARKHLPRLHEMGVDIVWLMPIHPIGEKGRKGTLGSYYAPRNYKEVNPEFGTMADFDAFLADAHKLGMHVIIDWVANHTSPDAVWISDHLKEWYLLDEKGNPVVQYDWTDIAPLDWQNCPADMCAAMEDAMRFWLERGVDGFRCDVAHQIPVSFWKPMYERFRKDFPDTYYLAEGENPALHQAFDASYAWELHHLMNDVAQGRKAAKVLAKYVLKDDSIAKTVPGNYWRLTFTSNHDENSWSGTEMERMGDCHRLMAMLTFLLPHSQPLIYTGQEVGFDHRFAFFEKDESPNWTANEYTDFYTFLSELRHTHPALAPEASFELIPQVGDSCLAFRRIAGTDTVSVFANLSHSIVTFEGDEIPPSQAVIGL
ncbi:MAG: alpha-amylase [Bacteroidaceae bacterium]|nr:alpha-amylase [Bacteroidaceae bacterium]